MRLSVREYNLLDLHARAGLLSDAILVDNVTRAGRGYSLYTYGSYYIEVLFDEQTSYLVAITAFVNGPRLDKYLQKISLDVVI